MRRVCKSYPDEAQVLHDVLATTRPGKGIIVGAKAVHVSFDFTPDGKLAEDTGKLDTDAMLYSIEDVNKHCLEEFRRHWTCLDNNNQQLWQCRPAEWKLNKCVFDNLVSPLVLYLGDMY